MATQSVTTEEWSHVGTGTYGSVHVKNGIAVKRYRKGGSTVAYHEYSLLRRLSCVTNVVSVQGVSMRETGEVDLVMHDGGETLYDYLDREGNVDVTDVFGQIAAGLRGMHAMGVAHLDLKLDNMLRDDTGFVRICDLNLSRLVVTPDGTRQTIAQCTGSRHYAGPEALRPDTPYDGFRADVWSLGIVLFTLLFRQFPFQDAHDECPHYTRFKQLLVFGSPTCALHHMYESKGWYRQAKIPTWVPEVLDYTLCPDPNFRGDLV